MDKWDESSSSRSKNQNYFYPQTPSVFYQIVGNHLSHLLPWVDGKAWKVYYLNVFTKLYLFVDFFPL